MKKCQKLFFSSRFERAKMAETKEAKPPGTKEEAVLFDLDKNTASERIYLNIGGRRFETRETVLRRSEYFSVLLDDKTFGRDPINPVFL
jgi:hypothetical protein